MRRAVVLAVAAMAVLSVPSIAVRADIETNTVNGEIEASAEKHKVNEVSSHYRTVKSKGRQGAISMSTEGDTSGKMSTERDRGPSKAASRISTKMNAAVELYKQQLASRGVCLASDHSERCAFPLAPDFANATKPLKVGGTAPAADPKAAPRVVITPEQVAYIAFARLKLTPPKPKVGPPPASNKWNMAAVGYPLWLWTDGNPHPAPVSDSVGGLFVSLDARVSKTVFTMGDGARVTCRGVGKKWTNAVPAAQKSPTCGHTYATPSLPKGAYTIRAATYWSVAWNVTGVTGVIPFVQSVTTTVPVGELQVLVR